MNADQFADSIGVNTHTSYNSGGVGVYYADTDRLVDLLGTLGIRNVRDSHQQSRADQRATLRKLTDTGARLTLQQDPRSSGTLAGRVQELADGLIPGVEALEGPNEFNMSGATGNFPGNAMDPPPTWLAGLDSFMNNLRQHRDTQLPSLALYDASYVGSHSYVWARYLRFLSEYVNIHPYPAGQHPNKVAVATWWWDVHANAGWVGGQRSPFVITETGYHNAVNQTGGHVPVPESVAAAYIVPLLIESCRAGAYRTFLYELIDQYPDPELDQAESNFGLAYHAPPGTSFALKPQGVAVANLLGVMRRAGSTDDNAESPITYTNPTGVESATFRRADNSWVTVFWQTASLWDTTTRTAVTPGPDITVTVTLPNMVCSKTILQTGALTGLNRRSTVNLAVPATQTVAFAYRP